MTTLFSTYTLKGKTCPNRLVMPPMVCFFGDNFDGFVKDETIAHYQSIAQGGCGTIIVEAACVSENGKLHVSQLGIWDDKFIPGLAKIVAAVHQWGALCLLQIHHAGVKTKSLESTIPLSPSNYSDPVLGVGQEMSVADIETTTQQFAYAAKRAEQAGFDGVEIHGCHGYLISQFLSPTVNKRTDIYGKNKALFGADIIKSVRGAVAKDFIVGIRTSGNDPDATTSVAYARVFEKAGADFLHVSTGFLTEQPPDLPLTQGHPNNWIVQAGIHIQKHVKIPVMVVNGIKTPAQAQAVLENDLAPFVAVGKGQWADTQWANKARNHEMIHLCLGCANCTCSPNIDQCIVRKKGVKP